MTKEFWTIREVVEHFEIDERFLAELEAEEIVCPVCQEEPPTRHFPLNELEKLRLAKLLVDEMGVNLPGVEIILRMRKSMIQMRSQFDAILEDLARQMEETAVKER
jgi:MerR family transcriptional regulator/heat shock protein HspR